MIDIVASFLIVISILSIVLTQAITGVIYAFMILSFIVILLGTVRGGPRTK